MPRPTPQSRLDVEYRPPREGKKKVYTKKLKLSMNTRECATARIDYETDSEDDCQKSLKQTPPSRKRPSQSLRKSTVRSALIRLTELARYHESDYDSAIDDDDYYDDDETMGKRDSREQSTVSHSSNDSGMGEDHFTSTESESEVVGKDDDPDRDDFGMGTFLNRRRRTVFKFDPTSYPKPGTRFVVRIKTGVRGRCEQFFRINRLDKLNRPCVKCLNCLRKRRLSKKNKDIYRQPTRQWAFLPAEGGEPGEYQFVDDPHDGHGFECDKDKITLGAALVAYTMKNALYTYQQNPRIRPIDPFNEARRMIPVNRRNKKLSFRKAEEEDWMLATPQWDVTNSAWTKARRDRLPKFDYNNVHREYARSVFGRDRYSKSYREPFVLKADKRTGYVFAMTNWAGRHLLKCTHIILDGTFRAVKSVKKCRQLLTIHGRTLSGEVHPMAYFLLPSKTSAMYAYALRDLRRRLRYLNNGSSSLGNLKVILGDWEEALDGPAAKHFSELKRSYCAFHYAQSIIRGVARYGLTRAYRGGDDVVRRYVHCVLGAMLCPPKYINLLAEIMELVPEHDDPEIHNLLRRFRDYVCNEYFRDESRRKFLDHFSTKFGWPRTSNCAEGFHSKLYEALRIHGSDIRRLLFLLQDVEYHSHYRLYQLSRGRKARYRKDAYVQLDKRIDYAKSKIVGILDGLQGAALIERLRRWCRYCSHLLGGAHHVHLVGKQKSSVIAAMDRIDGADDSATILNMANIDPDLRNLRGIDIVPWEYLPYLPGVDHLI